MRSAALAVIALAACKSGKSARKDVTCDDVRHKPGWVSDEEAPEFLRYCQDHPDEFTQAFMRCLVDARTDAELDACGDLNAIVGDPVRSPAEEAQAQLARIEQAAKAYFVESAKFPAGTAALTPATPCCDQRDGVCQPDPAPWSAEPWRTLDFDVYEPTPFRYAYEGTDTTLTATAVGDPECDGTTVTFSVTGTVEDGAPVFAQGLGKGD